jgi:hypothetical protein
MSVANEVILYVQFIQRVYGCDAANSNIHSSRKLQRGLNSLVWIEHYRERVG